MSNLKEVIKQVLFYIPVINHLFIFFNYKIFKTSVSIHEHKINHLFMTKNNYLIYDNNNAGKITGLDKKMNYEFAFSKKIIDLANKDRIFFDIGAAYGHYSWLASKLYKKVYCFEGDQLELFFLKRNMKQFKNVEIIERFLTAKFNIDKIIDQMDVIPNVIKIDVEGEEIQILENCEKTLKSGAYFLIEFHKRKILKKYNGNSEVIENFYKKFDKFGYSLEFNNHHSYEKLISDGISDKTWTKEKLNTNNFAIFAKPK